MTWRVLWTEMRRGPALLAGLLAAVASTLILQGEPIGARWMSMASATQYSLFLVAPLVMAVAVWHGGRERRRRIGEQVDSVPRPRSASVFVSWAALTAGTFGGLLLVVVGFGGLQVAPRATYWGGGWWWVVAAACAGLAVITAIGMLVGRLLPYRALAPLVAIGTYALLVFVLDTVQWMPGHETTTTMADHIAALVPLRRTNDLDWHLITVQHGVSVLVWLLTLAVAALVVSVARRVLVRVGVSLLALVAAWYVGYHGNEIVEDAAARELVCDAGELTVCVTRVNAYGLDAARTAAEQAFAPFSDMEAASWTAVEFRFADQDVPAISLSEFDGGWSGHPHLWPKCSTWSPQADQAATVATVWASSAVTGHATTPFDDTIDPLVETLTSRSDANQREWMSRYIAAASTCDHDQVIALSEELA